MSKWLQAYAQRASILVYFSSWTEQGWISALDSIVHDKGNGPNVISVSWGNAEDADFWLCELEVRAGPGNLHRTISGVSA
jgi:hypothetical protein